MIKTSISNLDLDLFYEKLDNGLEIYVIPKPNSNNIYANLTTKFGGVNTEFIPINETEYIKVPDGIAHFLEHKIFEQENNIDPFTIFDKNGASANAYTSNLKTSYIFSGPDNFDNNLSLLFDFVYNPYFTDQNVEKEKGIIVQEIKMCDDVIFRRGYNQVLSNCFINHPLKVPTIGSVSSVLSITKEDLYKCYNTFYNYSNMILVVTGNIIFEKVKNVIEKNIDYKKTINLEKPIIKEYNEPDNVFKEKEIIKMNTLIPKLFFGIKINIEKIELPISTILSYLSIYFDSAFGATSLFNSKLKEKEIISENIEYVFVPTNKHIIVIFLAESKKNDELIDEIKSNLNSNIDEKTFLRKKKVYLSSIISGSDDIFSVNNKITNDIINNGFFDTNYYNKIKDLNYVELNEILNKINYNNQTVVIIEPKH